MSVVGLVEKHAGDLAVVYGTPPPLGRDLDILVRDQTADRLRSVLTEHGYEVLSAGDGAQALALGVRHSF